MRNRSPRAAVIFDEINDGRKRSCNFEGWCCWRCCWALAFAGLGYRLVDLQVLRHEELSAKARDNTQRQFLLEPRRGDILDAKGNLLATSAFVKTVCADPALIGNRQAEVARAMAPLLQMSEAELLPAAARRA